MISGRHCLNRPPKMSRPGGPCRPSSGVTKLFRRWRYRLDRNGPGGFDAFDPTSCRFGCMLLGIVLETIRQCHHARICGGASVAITCAATTLGSRCKPTRTARCKSLSRDVKFLEITCDHNDVSVSHAGHTTRKGSTEKRFGNYSGRADPRPSSPLRNFGLQGRADCMPESDPYHSWLFQGIEAE